MVNYRSHFRDLDGWSGYGVPLTTTSNEAVKMYDAALDQMVYYYNDPQLGGAGECIRKMFVADPNFVAGNLLKLSLELYVTNNDQARAKFDAYCAGLDFDKLHSFEKMHIGAARCLYKEDLVGAMKQYAKISEQFPYDIHSFNLGFVLGLITGHTSFLRDIPLAIVDQYKPHQPHYGLVHGKLCFGHAEMAEYESAKRCGDIALEAFPLDSWAVHAMAHMYENQSQPKEEIKFLEETAKHWTRGINFSHHIHWHNANAYTQLRDYDSAMSIYDTHIAPCTAPGDVFPLSDASSLLMRMKIDGQDIGDRHIRLAQVTVYFFPCKVIFMTYRYKVRLSILDCISNHVYFQMWSECNDDFTSFFYEGHSSFAAAMAGDTDSIDTLLTNMREYIASDRGGWNKVVTTKYGVQLVEGMRLMSEEDYAGAAVKLAASVPEVVKMMHGSKAQKSIFSLVYVNCAVLSGNKVHLDQVRLESKIFVKILLLRKVIITY